MVKTQVSSSSNEELDIEVSKDNEEIIIKSGSFVDEKKVDINKELVYLALIFVASILVFKIVFYKESIMVVSQLAFSFFFLYILPGFSIMYYWKSRLEFVERFIIGFPLGAAITGSFGFLLGLFGIKLIFQVWLIPIVCFILGWWFVTKTRNL